MVQRLVRKGIGSCLLFVNLDRNDSLYVYVLTCRPSQTNTRKRKGSPVYADARIGKFCLVSGKTRGGFERKALPTKDLVIWAREFFKRELGVDLAVPCAMVGGGTLGMTQEQANALMVALMEKSIQDLVRQTIEIEQKVKEGQA